MIALQTTYSSVGLKLCSLKRISYVRYATSYASGEPLVPKSGGVYYLTSNPEPFGRGRRSRRRLWGDFLDAP